MAKTKTTQRADDADPISATDTAPREMRLDTAHRGASQPSKNAGHTASIPVPHIDPPRLAEADGRDEAEQIAWEPESLSAAEAALLEAWEEFRPLRDSAAEFAALLSGIPDDAHASPDESASSLANQSQLTNDSESALLDESLLLPTARTQLRQLAALLKERQTDLDRREANLHARQAELDEAARGAQLALREADARLTERACELQARGDLLAEREQTLTQVEQAQAGATAAVAQERESLRGQYGEREARLREWEITLSQRTERLELHEQNAADHAAAMNEQTACLAVEAELYARRCDALRSVIRDYLRGEIPRAVSIDRLRRQPHAPPEAPFDADAFLAEPATAEREFQQFVNAIRELAERRARLFSSEDSLVRGERELQTLREQLLAERREWEARKILEGRDHAARREREQAQHEELQAATALAERQWETRRAATEQLRAELAVTQRDILQERLTLEETATDLAGIAAPAKLAEALFRARWRLAEFYRWHTEQLADERRKLELLVAELPAAQLQLQQRRRELEHWSAQREAEFAGFAARLAAREQELDYAATAIAEQQTIWTHERAALQREMRKLLSELGR